MKVTHTFPPFVEADSTVLILGSIPSEKSREAGFYYMHKKNRFWKVLSLVYDEDYPDTLAAKKAFLKRHKIALFDVLASCDIEGSRDDTIQNPVPNKLLPIFKKSQIARIYTTGKKAYVLYQKYLEKELDLKAIPLPSTSALNATFQLADLKEAYQVIQKKDLEKIITPLLLWYQKERRLLPWRKTKDPYAIWISEVMLQQTRVEAVVDYYLRFLEVLPNIQSLATVEEDVLFKLWEGLGYYTRARNLQKAARKMVADYKGVFPKDYRAVLSLPGIGSYTAGAITSIAFDQPNPAVDGNVLRVVTRVLGLFEDITMPLTKVKIENRIREVLTQENASLLNQALMELGAMICLPQGKAKCDHCPLAAVCKAKEENLVATLPIKPKKKQQKRVEKTIIILECNGRYAIFKRPNKGLLAGLYQFPEQNGMQTKEQVQAFCRQYGMQAIYIKELASSKHVFTHLTWYMKGYFVRVEEECDAFLWVQLEELDAYSIPVAYSYYHPKNKDIYF